MFDTMTMTKIVGGFCGTFLIFLLGNWAAEGLYTVGASAEGHSAEPAPQAYSIAVVDAGPAPAAGDSTANFDEVYAAADAAKGEKIFAKCKACHKIDGTNGTGPHLNGVVGRDIASVPDFSYSAELQSLAGNWEPVKIEQFITKPSAYAPGTKMGFAGLPKMQDRADVIAFLATQK